MAINFLLKEDISENDYKNLIDESIKYFNPHDAIGQSSSYFQSYESFMMNDAEQILIIKDNERLVGSVQFIMSSRSIMEAFLADDITEQILFEKSLNNQCYETVYFDSAFVHKTYRGQQLSSQAGILLLSFLMMKYFNAKKPIAFVWYFSRNGESSAQRITKALDIELREKWLS